MRTEFVNVVDPLEKLTAYVEAEQFRGYDPYDALNSPILRMLTCGAKYPRIAVTQALKRCPVNLRPLLWIKKGYNPKGLGLFLWSYAKLYRATRDPKYLEQVAFLLERLAELKSVGCSGNGWGYNFNWQSRAFYVPRGTPTIVNSSFIGHALLDAYQFTGSPQALELAVPIQDFILRDLRRTEAGEGFCFSYTPIDSLTVHNANLLGASLLIRLQEYTDRPDARDAALRSLQYSMERQRPDGSWWYADTNYQQWIDSFHTGFNLQSIQYILDAGVGTQWADAFELGVRFYADNFFLDDGTAKYYHNRCAPLDIHSCAQAIVFFSRQGAEYGDLVQCVLRNMLATFQDPKGYFYFQQRAQMRNKIPYIRWAQSWALHAMTEYFLHQQTGRAGESQKQLTSDATSHVAFEPTDA